MIINFLNDVYVKFDDFLKINFDVYKVLKICDFIVNLLFWFLIRIRLDVILVFM